MRECREYVDALKEEGRLEGLPHSDSEFRSGGFDGLGFMEGDSVAFGELYDYLMAQRLDAEREKFVDYGRLLLKKMRDDPDEYYRTLCGDNKDGRSYDQVPVLAAINEDEFVRVLLKLHPTAQATIMIAFNTRYKHGQLEGALAAERPWITHIKDALEAAKERMEPLPRARWERLLRWNLAGLLSPRRPKTTEPN